MISELQRHRELMVCTTIGLIVVVLGYWMSSTPPHRSGQPLYNFVVMFLGGFLVGLLVRGGIREGVRSLVFYGMLVSVGTALPGIIHPGPIPSPFVLNLAVFASYIIPPNIVSGVLAILIRNFAEKMKGGMNFIQETGKGLIIPMLGIISGSVVILILQVDRSTS
jgi:hypothetical protein